MKLLIVFLSLVLGGASGASDAGPAAMNPYALGVEAWARLRQKFARDNPRWLTTDEAFLDLAFGRVIEHEDGCAGLIEALARAGI